MKHKLQIIILLCCYITTQAQTASDGFKMYKGELCTVIAYGQSSWTNYWEGTRLKDNKNIGTFTSKIIMPMLGYGITDKINSFVSLPFINNSSNAGTMLGMSGWQDISVGLKILYLEKTIKNDWNLKLFASTECSTPITKYTLDFLPYSIGLGAQTIAIRTINHLEYKNKYFISLQTGYTLKSNITTYRETYYNDDKLVYSNKMPVADVLDGNVKIGIDNSVLRADLHYQFQVCTSGADIRRNDMPYPFYKMDAQAIGASLLFWIPQIDGLAITSQIDQTIAGRNVGKALTWHAGIQYVFQPFSLSTAKNKKNETK